MQASQLPSKIPLPFANSGTKNTIPTASQIGITAGAASLTDGFPPLTMTPLSAGGVPPAGADFNGILNLITAIQQWQSAGGSFKFDSAFATSVGGYPKGAILMKATNDGFWMSTADSNTANPDSGGANWVDLFASAFVYSKGGSGYIKFPGANAPIIQWGSFTSSSGATTPVLFNTPFPNSLLSLVLTPSTSAPYFGTFNNQVSSGFNGDCWNTSGGRVVLGVIYLAVGY